LKSQNTETQVTLDRKLEKREKCKICYSELLVKTALMSKAERCEWNLIRDKVVNLAKYFNSSEEKYFSRWLYDKIIEAV
jgi:hypothetical protein